MAQYIDKSALVAEIEKRRNKHFNFGGSPSSEYCYEDDKILGIIDSLEVKEVDLEKEIIIYLGDNWKQDTPIEVQNDMISYAKHFFELGLKVQKGE